MLVELIAHGLRVPAARRRLWRLWYGFLAERDPARDWTFMNYGFRSDEPLDLAPEQEADRWCIQLYHRLAAAAPLRAREVLEVGSGRGGGAAWLHAHHQPGCTTGVDYAAANVAFCRRRHVAEGLRFALGDAEALPFEGEAFDAVLNLESSHCYRSRAAFYREASRVLRSGGSFEHADLFDPDDLPAVRSSLRAAGFEALREDDISDRVADAMELDDARKRELIASRVPAWLRDVFGQFAGLEGSRVHAELRAGSLRYLHFGLRRSPVHG